MIRAKMMCESVEHRVDQDKVTFSAANGKSGSANAQWSKWTPYGTVTLGITNPDARGNFKPGQYYFVDFTETDENG